MDFFGLHLYERPSLHVITWLLPLRPAARCASLLFLRPFLPLIWMDLVHHLLISNVHSFRKKKSLLLYKY